MQFGQLAQFGDGLDIYEWGWPWIKIQPSPNLKEGVLRDQKRKICPFLNQSIKSQKLYNISKNKLPKLIRRGDIGISPLFDLEKVMFLLYLPFKLRCELEITHLHLIEVLDVSFGVLTFQHPFTPLQPQMCVFWSFFFHILSLFLS